MKWFRILIGGGHFKMDVSGERRYMGFFVTRFVKAATLDLARASAIAAVRADARLDGLILNEEDDPPLIFVEEAEEVSALDVTEGNPGFVLFKDEGQPAGADISPPPYLVIRRGVSFWVEYRPLSDWTAAPQAFDEGCFRHASIYDANGDLWQIVHATFRQRRSFLNRLLPWRQLPVLIGVRSDPKPTLPDILAELAATLEPGNSFSENLDADPAEILECLRSATTPPELISCARAGELLTLWFDAAAAEWKP